MEGILNAITIDYDKIKLIDALYLLTQNEGYMDGDKKCLVLQLVE
jgi:hypothetical protein